jgi:hypothetical protein
LAKIATLAEIENQWTLCDLADAHEALDIQAEADEAAMKEAEAKAKLQNGD